MVGYAVFCVEGEGLKNKVGELKRLRGYIGLGESGEAYFLRRDSRHVKRLRGAISRTFAESNVRRVDFSGLKDTAEARYTQECEPLFKENFAK